MKVLQVTGSISLRNGGSKALFGMCRALRESGIETHIATTDSDTKGRLKVPLGKLIEVEGSLVYHFSSPALSKYGFSWELSRWLARHINDYDLIHLHGIFLHAFISGVAAARRCKVPYVIRPMGQLAPWSMKQGRKIGKRAYLWTVGRRYFNGAAAIHYTSQEEQEGAERLGIIALGAVIPLGADEIEFIRPPYGTFRQDHPFTAGKKIVLFLSRIDPQKGLEMLIRALQSLRGRCNDFILLVAGEGKKDYEQKIRTLAGESGLQDRIIFTGFINGSNKRALFRDADIFVLPSYHENFGMAVVEAMAASIPVVISDKVNIHREVSAANAGIVTSCDSAEVALGLNLLLDDEALRRQMGENARRLVEQKYRWKTIAPNLIELYDTILQRSA